MISYLLFIWQRALRYVADNLHLLVVLVLLFLFPALFIYSGQQFLSAGRTNQDQLQKDRIAALHDALETVVTIAPEQSDVWQKAVDKFATENDGVEVLMVQKQTDGILETLASSDINLLAATSTVSDWHSGAAVRPGTTMIYRLSQRAGADWYTYRMFSVEEENYFISAVYNMSETEALFSSREKQAYWSLAGVYLLIGLLAVWHYMLTDYRRLYKAAQKVNESQTAFLHTVAHELRAPLTAVRGFSDMQTETNDLEVVHSHARKIKSASERTLLLVNDLLDAARIQSGKLELSAGTVLLHEVLDRAVTELETLAKQQDIELTCDVEEDLQVAADKARLQQVFVNIISNAVKYTKHGSVTISAADKGKMVEVRIADTGVGIASEDQKKIFTPFFRVESRETAAVTGTGLGMWITKQLVAAMGGTVGVESIKGTGTHVVVRLPKEVG